MEKPWERSADAGRRLAGRQALVTGAGSGEGLIGIGAAIAPLFADQGAKVGIVELSSEQADETRRLVEEIGGECVVALGDLTDAEAPAASVVASAFGGLDTLVNNGRDHRRRGPVDVDMQQWETAMSVNLTAIVLAAKYTIPHMRKYREASDSQHLVDRRRCLAWDRVPTPHQGGHDRPDTGLGLHPRSRRHRGQLHRPGHVFTPMGNQGGEEVREQRRRAGLLGTEGVAWDIAWPAVFLASDEARWITGVSIPVDAGTISSSPLGVQNLNDRSPV